MLTISPEAKELIEGREKTVFLDMPVAIKGCCFELQERPVVRFGAPAKKEDFVQKLIDGITVFVPDCITEVELTITVSSFFGRKKLFVEGWRYI
jgi:hypothetical protein